MSMKTVYRSIARILSGTASAQLITLLAMPVISILYSPADYGKFGVIVAVTTIITIVCTFQLHQAIVLPKFATRAVGLFQLSCLGALAGGILTAIAGYIYWGIFEDDLQGVKLLAMSLLTGLAVAAAGIGHATQGMAVREKLFGNIGIAAVIRAGVVVIFHIGMGLGQAGAIGLLAGYVVGEIATLAYLNKHLGSSQFFTIRRSQQHYRALANRYKDFTGYGTAQEAMNSASQGLPVILLAIYYGQTVAGYYSFAIKIVMAPVNLIGSSLRQVLSVRFAASKDFPSKLSKDFRRATISLAVPSLISALLIMPFTPELFSALFGQLWQKSGEYGAWILLWCVFGIFNIPANLVFRVLRKQKVSFNINFMIFATRASLLVMGGLYWPPMTTVIVFALAGVLWNIVLIGVANNCVTQASAAPKFNNYA